jgi:hypothetical protein
MNMEKAAATTREWQWLKTVENMPAPPLPGPSPAARHTDIPSTREGYAALADMASVLLSAIQEQARRERQAEDIRRSKEPRAVFGAVALARSHGVLENICGQLASGKGGASDLPSVVMLIALTCKEWHKALKSSLGMMRPLHLLPHAASHHTTNATETVAAGILLEQLHQQQQQQQQHPAQQHMPPITHHQTVDNHNNNHAAAAHRSTPMAKLKQGFLSMRGGGDDLAKKGMLSICILCMHGGDGKKKHNMVFYAFT